MSLGTLDIIYLVPLVVFMILGFRKGFIIEIITIVALVVAVTACLRFTHIVLQKSGVEDDMVWWIPYLAYVIVFAVIFFVIMWIGKILEKFIKFAQLSFINNILGAFVGAFKITFVFSLFLWVTNQTILFPKDMTNRSVSFKYVEPIAPKVIDYITDNTHVINNIVCEVEDLFNKLLPDY